MKVCPYCSGITEESKAIKCEVCGRDISQEKEYTKEELENDLIQEEIEILKKNRIRKQRLKKVIITFSIIMIVMSGLVISYLVQPKGYIDIVDSSYEARIGETIEIKLNYGGKVSSKNVELEIVSTIYDGTKISFRYYIEGDICYITTYLTDQITLKFNVKDNGEQYKYNNIVRIRITE